MVLSIDPGTSQSGFYIGNPFNRRTPIYHSGKLDNGRLLLWIERGLDGGAVSQVIIEQIACYGLAVGREVLTTCEWVGVFEYASARSLRVPVKRMLRRDVKEWVLGCAKGTDSQVRAALIERFGPSKLQAIGTAKRPGPLYALSGDAWAAFAVACAAEMMQNPSERLRPRELTAGIIA